MHIMFRPILEKFKDNAEIDPTGLLLFLLASIIYHSHWLGNIVAGMPGHHFSIVLILNKPKLLGRLKLLVSLEKGGQVTRVTWIPPHIENAVMGKILLLLCDQTLKEVKSLTLTVKDAVSSTIEEKAKDTEVR